MKRPREIESEDGGGGNKEAGERGAAQGQRDAWIGGTEVSMHSAPRWRELRALGRPARSDSIGSAGRATLRNNEARKHMQK
eukprot:2681469-Pyramimonas_sp.AAC.1